MNSTCNTCGKLFASDGDRTPVVFDCMCVFCMGCSAEHEASYKSTILQKKDTVDGETIGKDEGEEDEQRGGIPCISCSQLRTTPLQELLPSFPHIQAAALVAGGQVAVPRCDICADEFATKHCSICKKNKKLCDECYAHVHRKKTDHKPTSIQTHLQESRDVPDGETNPETAGVPKCTLHANHYCEIFCATCDLLICAMCAAFGHIGHDYWPISEASGQHKDALEALVALNIVVQDEIGSAKAAWESAAEEIKRNGEVAKKQVVAGFARVMHQGMKRREAMVARIEEIVQIKVGMLEAQITWADKKGDHSTDGIKLARAMLELASPTQVLQYKKLLGTGLAQLHDHGSTLEQCCEPTLRIQLGEEVDSVVSQIYRLGSVENVVTKVVIPITRKRTSGENSNGNKNRLKLGLSLQRGARGQGPMVNNVAIVSLAHGKICSGSSIVSINGTSVIDADMKTVGTLLGINAKREMTFEVLPPDWR